MTIVKFASDLLTCIFRYKRRDETKLQPKLTDIDENQEFIANFEEWFRNQKFDTSQDSQRDSTIRRCVAYLFSYPDSLLKFNTEKYKDYNLQQHVKEVDGKILEVCDPTAVGEWLQSIAGQDLKKDPARRFEMLKAHARYRDFVYEQISKINFGSSAEAYIKKDLILRNLKEITEKISKRQVFQKLTKLKTYEKEKLKIAREIVFPDENFNEQNAVSKWFGTEEARAEEEKNLAYYEKVKKGYKGSGKEFNSFANWARFTTAIIDKNRRGAYNFTNEHFVTRCPKWLPASNKGEEFIADEYEMIPKDWNPNEAPEEGMEATCWVIRIPGDTRGLKLGESADIVLTRKVVEICMKFSDIKETVLENVGMTDPFFVNFKGKQLAPIQRVKGSLLYKMGKAVGLENLTMNSFRRAAEKSVQGSPKLKEHIKAVQSHSIEVGAKYYYRGGENVRAQFISQMSEKEVPNSNEEVPEDVKKNREATQKKQRERILRNAKNKLAEEKMRKNLNYKVQPRDRAFMQNIFSSDQGIKDSTKFPGDYF